MITKKYNNGDGFVREILFIKKIDYSEFKQVTSNEYIGIYSLGDGVFQKDGKFYIKYYVFSEDFPQIHSVQEYYKQLDVDPLEYYFMMKQVFPVTVKKKDFY